MKAMSPHYTSMTLIMIIAGLFSTMNVWANSWSDIRFSINDLYMISLMTSIMIFLMSIINADYNVSLLALCITIVTIYAIRKQIFVDEKQYLLGMIPHHSMAIHMSNRLLEKSNGISNLLKDIIQSQTSEIIYMKKRLQTI